MWLKYEEGKPNKTILRLKLKNKQNSMWEEHESSFALE